MPQTQEIHADATLNAVADIIQRRVDAYGAKANVHREGGTRFTVELTGIGAAEAEMLTGRTGLVEFREVKRDGNGDILLCNSGKPIYDPPGCQGGQQVPIPADTLTTQTHNGSLPTPPDSLLTQTYESIIWVPAMATGSDGQEVALTGRFLQPSSFLSASNIGLPVLNFEMTAEGTPLLEQITNRLIGLPMSFFMDGQPIRAKNGSILAPVIRAVISDKGIIEGLALDDARTLSILLNSGVLPVPLKVIKVEDFRE